MSAASTVPVVLEPRRRNLRPKAVFRRTTAVTLSAVGVGVVGFTIALVAAGGASTTMYA
jgi:hypothetical protein